MMSATTSFRVPRDTDGNPDFTEQETLDDRSGEVDGRPTLGDRSDEINKPQNLADLKNEFQERPSYARNIFTSFLVLYALTESLAVTLRRLERPKENRRNRKARDYNRFLSDIQNTLLRYSFGFYLDECEGYTCDECAASRETPDGPPRLEASREWGVYLKLKDNWSVPCPRDAGLDGNATRSLAEMEAAWLGGELSTHCRLVCPLALPKFEAVDACQLYMNTFDQACLNNTAPCENCDRLRGDVAGLSNSMFPRDDPRRAWDNAFVYWFYLRSADDLIREVTHNWRREKSIYFAFSIVSSVGYGDFSVTTREAKWIITIVTIPYIAIFAFALSQLAQVFISLLTQALTHAHANYEKAASKLDRRRWNAVIDRMLERDDDGCLTENQFVEAATVCQFGLPEGEMRRLYRQLDSDMSGLLDRDELSTMMDVISNINKAKVVKMRAYWHLLALLFLLVLVIGVGMFAYAYAMGWTYADALYFIVVTLTTVGFGDFVPKTHFPPIILWLAHSVIGLGIVTSFISAMQDLGINQRRLAKLSNELLKLHVVARPHAEHDGIRRQLWNDLKGGYEKVGHLVSRDLEQAKQITPVFKSSAAWGDVRRASLEPATKVAPALVTVAAASRAAAYEAKDDDGADAAVGGGPGRPDGDDGLLYDARSRTWVDPDAAFHVRKRGAPRRRRRS